MSKETLFSLTIILTIVGISVTAGHPEWGVFTGAAILLLAAGTAAGAVKARSQYENRIVERPAAGQKISSSLVTLSSAAIFAVYAAGYHRTGSAADKFAAQDARRRTAAAIVAGAVTPQAALPQIAATPAVRPSSTPLAPPRKARPRVSSGEAPRVAQAPAEDSPAAPSAPPDATPPGAPAIEAAAPQPQPPVRYKDGTYLGWGRSRHGDIQASVVIEAGRIVSSAIVQCLTRYSCSWIASRVKGVGYYNLPEEVVARQSANVDYVSGATESSDAFYGAITSALSQASE
jgi:uncharacterized protein with FMN-binding domain